jgi:hypothetical protein
MLILATYFKLVNILPSRRRWARYAAHVGGMRNRCKILLGQPEGQRLLGRHRPECMSNVKLVLTEIGYDSLGLINLAEKRLL